MTVPVIFYLDLSTDFLTTSRDRFIGSADQAMQRSAIVSWSLEMWM